MMLERTEPEALEVEDRGGGALLPDKRQRPPGAVKRKTSGAVLAAVCGGCLARGSEFTSAFMIAPSPRRRWPRTPIEEASVPTVNVVHPQGSAPNEALVLPGQTMAFTDTPIYARTNGYLKQSGHSSRDPRPGGARSTTPSKLKRRNWMSSCA